MSRDPYPVGLEFEATFAAFRATLTLISDTRLKFEIKEGPFAHSEVVDIQVTPLGGGLFLVSWQEDSGATVTHVQDFDRGLIHSQATLPDGRFLRMTGPITIIRPADATSDDRPARNKALVLEAMTGLFQRRDASLVERFYAADYIQHNPDIPQGRDALAGLVEQLTDDVWYEPGLIVAEGDLVAIHGRIRGWAETPQIVVDLFRVEAGRLAEHWDVLQDERPVVAGRTDLAMFHPDEAKRGPVV